MISERAIRRVVDQYDIAVNQTAALERNEDVQIILDASASMAGGDGSKEQCARELALALLRLGARAGRPITVWALRGAERNRTIDPNDADRLVHLPFDGIVGLDKAWPAELAASTGVRAILSDFLFEADPNTLVERAATGTGKLFAVQLLDPTEIDPEPAGVTQLVDIESEESTLVLLDANSIHQYKSELARLQQEYGNRCSAMGASWISASSGSGLERLCSQHLVPAGLLFPTDHAQT
jgi:hypothetical protein